MTLISISASERRVCSVYFRGVFGKTFSLSAVFFFAAACLSMGQELKVLQDAGRGLEGAGVSFRSLSNQKTHFMISDKTGRVKSPGLSYPVAVSVMALGFENYSDTLYSQSTPHTLVMKPSPLELGELTVTGSIMPQYQNQSSYKIDVLTREDIQRKAAQNVGDLLVYELSMRLNADPVLGSGLEMQGIGGENIKVLIDGVPVIGRQDGNLDMGQLSLSNVERVELVRGPMSSLYGTDALGGVINLISKKQEKPSLSAGLNTFYESSGHYNIDGALGYGFSKSSLRISGGRNYFDGWSPVDTGRWSLWLPREQYFSSVRFDHNLGAFRYSLSGNFFDEEAVNKSEPVITPYFAYATDQTYRTRRWNGAWAGEWKPAQNQLLKFQASYSDYRYLRNTYRKDMVSLEEQLTADDYDDDTTRFKSVFSRLNYGKETASGNFNYQFGADFNYEQALGKKIDNNEHHITDLAVYSLLEYKVSSSFSLHPSLRYIWNSNYNAPLIPALNLLWNPLSDLNLRFSVSAGFRAPSLKEQYLNFVDDGIHNVRGNTELKAENSWHFNGSADRKWKGPKSVFTLSPSVYYTTVRDKISLVLADPSTALYSYVNIDHFKSLGLELQTRYSHEKFRLQGGVLLLATDGSIEGGLDQPEPIYSPEVNFQSDIRISKQDTRFVVYWKYYGERGVYQLVDDENVELFMGESWQMMDLSIQQKFFRNKLSVSAGARNVFDVESLNSVGTGSVHGSDGGSQPVATGRQWFLKMGLEL